MGSGFPKLRVTPEKFQGLSYLLLIALLVAVVAGAFRKAEGIIIPAVIFTGIVFWIMGCGRLLHRRRTHKKEKESMQYKLTIDINLMHEDPNIPAMDTLKRWKKEGKIDLIEAEPPKIDEPAYIKPANAPLDPRYRGGRRIIKREPSQGANFRGVAAVLFPQKDSQKLNMGEINDVAHLLKHHSSKNELFVTHNLKDFIDEGKRQRLKAAFGIIAMTPDEAVAMLSKIEGWK